MKLGEDMVGDQEEDLLRTKNNPFDDCTHWIGKINRRAECEERIDKILSRKLRGVPSKG